MKMGKWEEHIKKIDEELDMLDYNNLTDKMYNYAHNLIHLRKKYKRFIDEEKGENKEDMVFKVKFEGEHNVENLEETMHNIYDTFCTIDISTKGNDSERTFIKQKIKEIYGMFNGD